MFPTNYLQNKNISKKNLIYAKAVMSDVKLYVLLLMYLFSEFLFLFVAKSLTSTAGKGTMSCIACVVMTKWAPLFVGLAGEIYV